MRLSHCVPTLFILAGLAQLAAAEVPAVQPTPPVAQAPAQPPLLSDVQRAAILALYQQAVTLGLPDAAGGTMIVGGLSVSEPAPAGDDQRGRNNPRMMFRGNQNTSVKDGIKTSTYERSIHLRRHDGRWLLGMTDPLQADATHTITLADGAVEVTAATLLDAIAKDVNPARSGKTRSGKMRQGSEPLLAIFTASDRARVNAGMESRQAFNQLGIRADPGSMSTLHLLRLGVPQADALLVMASAMTVLPSFGWQFPSLASPTPIGLSAGSMRWMRYGSDWEKFQKDHVGDIALPPPEETAGRCLATWFSSLLLDETALAASGLSATKAADATLALSPATERTALRPVLDLLIARLALPAKAADNADLAGRLQCWEPGERGQFSGPEFDEATIAQMPAESQKHFRDLMAQRKAWKPAESDIAAILELLSDPRPSRWLDGQTPRTLGDNALRALSTLVGFDPRLLISRNPDLPWTEAERLATAEGLRAWWKALAGKPLADGLSQAIGLLPPAGMAAVLTTRPEETRAPLLDAVVTAWTAKAPLDQPPQEIASVLAFARDHAGMAALVKNWKPEGALRPLLACWRDRHGDPVELDALLDELSVVKPDAPHSWLRRRNSAINQALRTPSPARLQRFLTLAHGAPDDSCTWAILCAIAQNNNGFAFDADWSAASALDGNGSERMGRQRGKKEDSDPGRAVTLTVAATFLADQRVIPEAALKIQNIGESWAQIVIAGNQFGIRLPKTDAAKGADTSERKPPTGLRVRDLAGTALIQNIWQFGFDQELSKQVPDLWASAEERDRTMQPVVDAFTDAARTALAAANLPAVLPAAAVAPDKSMF